MHEPKQSITQWCRSSDTATPTLTCFKGLRLVSIALDPELALDMDRATLAAALIMQGSPEDGQHARSRLLADSHFLVVQPHCHSHQALHIHRLQRMCTVQCGICII